jgi:hypothetical protein
MIQFEHQMSPFLVTENKSLKDRNCHSFFIRVERNKCINLFFHTILEKASEKGISQKRHLQLDS